MPYVARFVLTKIMVFVSSVSLTKAVSPACGGTQDHNRVPSASARASSRRGLSLVAYMTPTLYAGVFAKSPFTFHEIEFKVVLKSIKVLPAPLPLFKAVA